LRERGCLSGGREWRLRALCAKLVESAGAAILSSLHTEIITAKKHHHQTKKQALPPTMVFLPNTKKKLNGYDRYHIIIVFSDTYALIPTCTLDRMS